jgi:hypothetical protein
MPICALCRDDRVLCQSHIVPKFVFDYLKETAATDYFRFANQPNRRVQDGPKIPLLCADCELSFSTIEKWFAETVFRPFMADESVVVEHDLRLLKFATSISFRVALYYYSQGHLSQIRAQQILQLEKAIDVWRSFLLDEIPHPGRYEQHFLPIGALMSVSVPGMAPNTNRYLARMVDTDVVTSSRTMFVYTKLPRMMVIGSIDMSSSRSEWQGTRIAAKRGVIRPRRFGVPSELNDYIMGKARAGAVALAGMSARQKQLINDTVLSDLDRAAGSESIRALSRDVDMFGKDAFIAESNEDSAE